MIWVNEWAVIKFEEELTSDLRTGKLRRCAQLVHTWYAEDNDAHESSINELLDGWMWDMVTYMKYADEIYANK